MPEWVPVTLVLTYIGMVVLMAFSSVFSETEPHRDAAYKVLRVLLPWRGQRGHTCDHHLRHHG